jgi:hypothetical protein
MPVVENGEVKDLVVSQHNVADDIIESFMVAANTAIARHLKERGLLSIRRVVRTPKRWDGIQAIAARFGVKLPALPDPRGLSDFLEVRFSDELGFKLAGGRPADEPGFQCQAARHCNQSGSTSVCTWVTTFVDL